MLRVAIVGSSGYTGVELTRILSRHPSVEIAAATSRRYDGMQLSEVFPNLRGCTDIVCRNHSPEDIISCADLVFCAVPHKTAMNIVPTFLDAGVKVVDLSADFRLKSVSTYEQWYQPHSSPELLSETVYGLPELYREAIGKARLVANPGCYPTSVILALAPVLKAGIIDPASIIADSKSGATGAGRGAAVGTLYCEVTDGFRAYKVGGTHRHTPEIEQELGILADQPLVISFTPHLLPVSRGILSTVYARLKEPCTVEKIRDLYQDMYQGDRFIRLLDPGMQPATQYVRGSNYCDLGLAVDARTGRLVITSAIDNIVKGASGQAVQNMNLMCGFPEDCSLTQVPIFP
jgi:N-acetyl-gamma-glutamyl-phosphate reductase